MKISRRTLILGAGAAGLGLAGQAAAAPEPLALTVAARSPWVANQVTLTSGNVMFLGLPRYSLDDATPSLARRNADGTFSPFPGNEWNGWRPGDDGLDAFVYLNSVHIFADDTVWCVDQGMPNLDTFPDGVAVPAPQAQKLVQLDAATGEILKIIRFDEHILPRGAKMNDLRFHGLKMYITDSGLGGIIVHDMDTGSTIRRLSGQSLLKASGETVTLPTLDGGKGKPFRPPNSDMIEISNDGAWLFWAAPTGPLYKIDTSLLLDAGIAKADLATRIERVADIAFSSGCAMDTAGNIYFCETMTGRITLLSPSGRKAVLISDPSFIRPDSAFISKDRILYVPVKMKRTDDKALPFAIRAVRLPQSFDGIPLGDAISGAAT